jgi:hypothetical protein
MALSDIADGAATSHGLSRLRYVAGTDFANVGEKPLDHSIRAEG